MQVVRNLSIRTKLIFLLVGACASVLVAACAAFVAYDRVSYGEAKARTLGVLSDTVAVTLVGPLSFQDPGSTSTVLGTIGAEPTALTAAAYTKEGKRLADWTKEGTDPLPETYAAGFATTFADHLVIERAIAQPTPAAEPGAEAPPEAPPAVGTLVVVFSTADIEARLWQFLRIAAGVLGGSVVMAFAVALFSHGLISDPVKRLAAAASKVQRDDDYTVRADIHQKDELGLLADAFNGMLQGIQERDAELTSHRDHLESLVADRTRDLNRRNEDMRLVLDNIDQAIVTVDADAQLRSERSAAFDRFFGIPAEDTQLGSHLGTSVAGFAEWFALSWESITDGFLPLELCIDQLPSRIQAGDNHFTLSYKPILEDDELRDVLVVITDVTAEVERRETEQKQREFLAVFEAMNKDRSGFEDFLNEADQLVAALSPEHARADFALFKRQVHTLKGNSAIYGLHSIAALCHTVEDDMESTGAPPTDEDLEPITTAWTALRARIDTVAGTSTATGTVSPEDWNNLHTAILDGVSRTTIAAHITRLAADPVGPRLSALGGRAENMAESLGKQLAVSVDDGGVRLPREPWAGLWNSLVHVVRNAVDHGIEAPDVRHSRGKDPIGRLQLQTAVVSAEAVHAEGPYARCGTPSPEATAFLDIRISDDGAGVAWERLTQLAADRGLPHDTQDCLVAAMFSDGMSTRDVATEMSGRGVGTAAVLSEVLVRGGCIDVRSVSGQGTEMWFRLPLEERYVPRALLAAA